eukprot:1851538-Rhodomonas_salina.1
MERPVGVCGSPLGGQPWPWPPAAAPPPAETRTRCRPLPPARHSLLLARVRSKLVCVTPVRTERAE